MRGGDATFEIRHRRKPFGAYPIHSETSERQMMVYFPQCRLLHGSDPFQQLPDSKLFYPQTVSELTAAVEREHFNVERFYI